MRMTTLAEQIDLAAFVSRAADDFSRNPQHTTFTDNDINSGELFAVRWGLGNDCVLTFRIGGEPPVVFQNCIVERHAEVPKPVKVSELPELIIHPKPIDTFDDDIPF